MDTKAAQRQKLYKSTVDPADLRKRSQNARVSIRKQRREQNTQKRRALREDFEDENQCASPIKESAMQMLSRLDDYARWLNSSDTKTQIDGTVGIRKLLSIEFEPPIDEVMQKGCVAQLVKFLERGDCPKLQFEAAWAITNVASGTTEQTFALLKLGAVPALVTLLLSPDTAVKEQGVWALGNIAGDSYQCRDYVLAQGVMPYLIELTRESNKGTLRRNATWSISNLFRGKPAPLMQLIQPAVRPLVELLKSSDTQLIQDACWALSYISDGDNLKIQVLIEAGACVLLVGLLMHQDRPVQTPALRVVGNICTGDDFQTQLVLDHGVLPRLKFLLKSSNSLSIQKEVCWTLSNITAGNSKQLQQVMDADLIPILVNILSHGEFEVMKEAAWAIANATSSGSAQQIDFLVTSNCIPPLYKLLYAPDHRIVAVSLEGLENILQHGEKLTALHNGLNPYAQAIVESPDGLDRITALQMHPNDSIVNKSVALVTKYFANQVEETDAVAPQVREDGTAFTFGGAPQVGGYNF